MLELQLAEVATGEVVNTLLDDFFPAVPPEARAVLAQELRWPVLAGMTALLKSVQWCRLMKSAAPSVN